MLELVITLTPCFAFSTNRLVSEAFSLQLLLTIITVIT